jgi:hypothetical protein
MNRGRVLMQGTPNDDNVAFDPSLRPELDTTQHGDHVSLYVTVDIDAAHHGDG